MSHIFPTSPHPGVFLDTLQPPRSPVGPAAAVTASLVADARALLSPSVPPPTLEDLTSSWVSDATAELSLLFPRLSRVTITAKLAAAAAAADPGPVDVHTVATALAAANDAAAAQAGSAKGFSVSVSLPSEAVALPAPVTTQAPPARKGGCTRVSFASTPLMEGVGTGVDTDSVLALAHPAAEDGNVSGNSLLGAVGQRQEGRARSVVFPLPPAPLSDGSESASGPRFVPLSSSWVAASGRATGGARIPRVSAYAPLLFTLPSAEDAKVSAKGQGKGQDKGQRKVQGQREGAWRLLGVFVQTPAGIKAAYDPAQAPTSSSSSDGAASDCGIDVTVSSETREALAEQAERWLAPEGSSKGGSVSSSESAVFSPLSTLSASSTSASGATSGDACDTIALRGGSAAAAGYVPCPTVTAPASTPASSPSATPAPAPAPAPAPSVAPERAVASPLGARLAYLPHQYGVHSLHPVYLFVPTVSSSASAADTDAGAGAKTKAKASGAPLVLVDNVGWTVLVETPVSKWGWSLYTLRDTVRCAWPSPSIADSAASAEIASTSMKDIEAASESTAAVLAACSISEAIRNFVNSITSLNTVITNDLIPGLERLSRLGSAMGITDDSDRIGHDAARAVADIQASSGWHEALAAVQRLGDSNTLSAAQKTALLCEQVPVLTAAIRAVPRAAVSTLYDTLSQFSSSDSMNGAMMFPSVAVEAQRFLSARLDIADIAAIATAAAVVCAAGDSYQAALNANIAAAAAAAATNSFPQAHARVRALKDELGGAERVCKQLQECLRTTSVPSKRIFGLGRMEGKTLLEAALTSNRSRHAAMQYALDGFGGNSAGAADAARLRGKWEQEKEMCKGMLLGTPRLDPLYFTSPDAYENLVTMCESLDSSAIRIGNASTPVLGNPPGVLISSQTILSGLFHGLGYVAQTAGRMVFICDRSVAYLPLTGPVRAKPIVHRARDVARVLRKFHKDRARASTPAEDAPRLSLRANWDFDGVIRSLRAHHESSWITTELELVWRTMFNQGTLVTMELYLGEELIAADITHPIMKCVYIATRYSSRAPAHRGLQPGFLLAMVSARVFQRAGYAIWSLGVVDQSPVMAYKHDLGVIEPGAVYLARFRAVVAQGPPRRKGGEPVFCPFDQKSVVIEDVTDAHVIKIE